MMLSIFQQLRCMLYCYRESRTKLLIHISRNRPHYVSRLFVFDRRSYLKKQPQLYHLKISYHFFGFIVWEHTLNIPLHSSCFFNQKLWLDGNCLLLMMGITTKNNMTLDSFILEYIFLYFLFPKTNINLKLGQ